MEKKKIILDCDPGHDDAVAIMLAAKAPEIDLLGLTVVAGNQTLENTTRNALNLVQYLDCDAPVYAGCPVPLVRERRTAGEIHGKTGLDGPEFEELKRSVEPGHAVSFIIDTLMASDGDITMVTTGPMTNLALALRLEPRIATKIKQLVLMGGSIGLGNVSPAAEFNILADPDAAHICFTAGIPTVMVGLDVTRQAKCDASVIERMERIGNKASDLFGKMMRFYCERQKIVFGLDGGPLHDPITVAWLINPDLLTLTPMNVQIDHSYGPCYGRTNCDALNYLRLPCNVEVATGIDSELFWNIIEEGIKRYD